MNSIHRLTRSLRTACLLSFLLLIGCSSGEDAHANHDHDTDSNHSHGNESESHQESSK